VEAGLDPAELAEIGVKAGGAGTCAVENIGGTYVDWLVSMLGH